MTKTKTTTRGTKAKKDGDIRLAKIRAALLQAAALASDIEWSRFDDQDLRDQATAVREYAEMALERIS